MDTDRSHGPHDEKLNRPVFIGSQTKNKPCLAPGFTVLELLTTLALLIVAMGLMVSLARYVRSNSADQMTRRMLLDLEGHLSAYHERFGDFPLADLIPDTSDEAQWEMSMRGMSSGLIFRLKAATQTPGEDSPPVSMIGGGEGMLTDAWGRTIGYLQHHHPQIGMAPQNRPFFFSAGPDGKYLTRQDNLYSYEQTRPDMPVQIFSGKTASTQPAKPGGQDE